MAAGSTVADFTTLEGLTGVSDNDWFLVISQGYGRYVYDSAGTAAANGDITRVHGAGGRWYASGQIFSDNIPSGPAELPVQVSRTEPGSTGGKEINRIYWNGGGGNSTWNSESI
ncbi:hypothetical protein N836_31370 [Leptolyngbya sp. Heron Island J]|uniref:hypothetical protein n=1 Tax=Leptolyngbya sp. Heron Island J TaxID=1385935 RepID=UPI0003B93D2E|nr:hypothetical protein [Leptolyngbya sp. Heron Island J]ESA38442.1 hypothetical protein N836_31370 [Leptolyngbya sp. Heron Island J]